MAQAVAAALEAERGAHAPSGVGVEPCASGGNHLPPRLTLVKQSQCGACGQTYSVARYVLTGAPAPRSEAERAPEASAVAAARQEEAAKWREVNDRDLALAQTFARERDEVRAALHAAQALIQIFGDRITDMFEQMERGHWTDDHGHDVRLNKAMHDLIEPVQQAIEWRAALAASPPAPEAQP
jgi:hypothetical protein